MSFVASLPSLPSLPLLLAGVFAGALAGLWGCEPEGVEPCGVLPTETACPASRGGTCDDVSCSAIYACEGGAWVLQRVCERFDGGPPAPSGAVPWGPPDASIDPGEDCDAGSPVTVMPPTKSCPPLQPPECDARLIAGCEATLCGGDCEVFLECVDGDWRAEYTAYCQDGVLVRP